MEVKENCKVQLIDGQFNPDEAMEILQNLISHKINFHLVKNFNSEVRYGVKATKSLKRIKDLQEANMQLMDIIQKASKEKFRLSIKANIEIEFI